MTPDLIYEQTDIPPGMSCAEYRRRVAARTPPHGMRAALRRMRVARVTDRAAVRPGAHD